MTHNVVVKKIPRIIHVLWFDMGQGVEPTGIYKRGYDSWIQHNADTCKIQLWSENDILKLLHQNDHYWLLDTWNKLENTIHKLDAIRSYLLDCFGGMYVDLDIVCTRPVEPLFWMAERLDTIILMQSHGSSYVTNSFMIGPRGHMFFKKVTQKWIHNVQTWKWARKDSWFTTMFMTGPQMLHECVQEYGWNRLHIYQAKHVFPFENDWTPESYGIDYLNCGWGKWKPLGYDILRWILMVVIILLFVVCIMKCITSRQ